MSDHDPVPLRPNVLNLKVPQDQAEEPPPGHIRLVVNYLEATSPPGPKEPPRPAIQLALLHALHPSLHFYRYLYNTIGRPWLWWERRLMDDEELSAILDDPLVEVYVLYADGVPAGYAELDRRPEARHTPPDKAGGKPRKRRKARAPSAPPAVNLAYFGLMPEFTGRGIGPFFLDQILRQAWTPATPAPQPERVTVNTCNLDHPKALSIYQRAGFQVTHQVVAIVEDPRKYMWD